MDTNVADTPMILAGIDPCFSCNDRAVCLKQPGGDQDRWTWETLRQYGIMYYQTGNDLFQAKAKAETKNGTFFDKV